METFVKFLDFIIYLAIIFAVIEVYLKVNKVWKRKEEKAVAESQSLYGLALSLFILTVWSIKYYINGDYTSIADNSVYLIETLAMITVGSGFFIRGSKRKGFWNLIKSALKLENKEASYLLNSISGKNEIKEIINILHLFANIDDDFDNNEKSLIIDFANHWNIAYSPDSDENIKVESEFTKKLEQVRESIINYISKKPNSEQISHLQDLIKQLIFADDTESKEEIIIFEEVSGLINQYLLSEEEQKYYHVIIVPQNEAQKNLIKTLKPTAEEIHTAGGIAFSLEKYLSSKYAEIMCDTYRVKGLFTIVYEL